MIKVNIHEAKTNLSFLLAKLEKDGEKIFICRNGIEVAELKAVSKKKRSLKVPEKYKVKFFEDPMKPLDPEDWGDLYLHDPA